MKILRNLLFLVSTITLFAACSSSPQEMLIGQWKVTENYYYEYTESGTEHRVSGKENGYIFNFKEDGTVDYISPDNQVQTWDYVLRKGEILMQNKVWDVEILNSRTLQIFIFGGENDGKPSFYRCQRVNNEVK